jgi:hypothetical protein
MKYQEVKEIVIQRRKMFDNAANVMYNLINDPFTNGAPTIHQLLIAFNDNPQFIHDAFKAGLTPCLMGNRMKEVTKFKEDELPFVILVRDGDEVFAIVSQDEVA